MSDASPSDKRRRANIVASVREIHRELGLSSGEDINMSALIDLCSKYALEMLEEIMEVEFDTVSRTPLFVSDHEHNARMAMAQIEKLVPGISLDHIDTAKVGQGDEGHCMNLLEIVCELYKTVCNQRDPPPASMPPGDAKRIPALGTSEELQELHLLLSDAGDGAPEDGVRPNAPRPDAPRPDPPRSADPIRESRTLGAQGAKKVRKKRKVGAKKTRPGSKKPVTRKRKPLTRKRRPTTRKRKPASARPKSQRRAEIKGSRELRVVSARRAVSRRRGRVVVTSALRSSVSTRSGKPRKRTRKAGGEKKMGMVGKASKIINDLKSIRNRSKGNARALARRLASQKRRLLKDTVNVSGIERAIDGIRSKHQREEKTLYEGIISKMESALKAEGHFKSIFSERVKRERSRNLYNRKQREEKVIRHLFQSAIAGQKLAAHEYKQLFKAEVTRLMDRELAIKHAMIDYLRDQHSMLLEKVKKRTEDALIRSKAKADQRRRLERDRRQEQRAEVEQLLDKLRQQEDRYKFEISQLSVDNVRGRAVGRSAASNR